MTTELDAPVVDAVVPPQVEEADDDFNSGFQTPDAPTVTPEPSAVEPEDETPPAAVAEPPKLASITEDQYQELLAKAGQVDSIHSQLEKVSGTAFGKIGGIERVLNQLQQSTPQGIKVDVTDDIVAELKEEFPELAGLQLAAFKKFAEKITGSAVAAPAQAAPVINEAAIVDRAVLRIAQETLNSTHEDWAQVVGLPDANGNIPETEYRKWLKTQPEAYRKRIDAANSPTVIGKSIDEFKDAQKKAEEAAAAAAKAALSRKERIAATVTPRGTGGAGTTANTEDDDFNAGFNGR